MVLLWPGPIIAFFVSTFLPLFAFDCIKLPSKDLGSSLYPGSTNTVFISSETDPVAVVIPIAFNTVFNIFLKLSTLSYGSGDSLILSTCALKYER